MTTKPVLIGRTGIIAKVLEAKIPLIKSGQLADPLERRWMFTGPAGVAKTLLAKTLAEELAGHPVNVDFRMGTQINVEVIRDWMTNAHYRPLFGDMMVRIIDEIDTVPTIAVTELRGYLDTLPPHAVFIGTTNKAVKDLVEPLQTRFAVWRFDPVQTSLVAQHLVKLFPDLPPATLTDIAQKTGGNVRAAITDAASERDVLRLQQLAA